MASILPDDVLNRLLCSICNKYLSYPPIKINKHNRVSCGRCNNNETTSPNSLYGNVAMFSLFPCVNRYEGCNKLLQYKDVAQHENVCKSNQFPCPLCNSDVPFALLSLIEHYKTVHKEYYLKEPKFVIDSHTMSDNVYLYCDNSSNSLFLIESRCTQDRLFLNAWVPTRSEVVQRFRINNIFQAGEALCSTLREPKSPDIEIKIANEWDRLLLCEFLYDVTEKRMPCVALDLSSVEEPMKGDKVYRSLPKIYLDNKIFSEKQKYKLSPCKSKLVNEYDSSFKIELKCDICDTYFWNVPTWPKIPFYKEHSTVCLYGLYCCDYNEESKVSCIRCVNLIKDNFSNLFKSTRNELLFNLGCYCRYNCGTICFVWNLHSHESLCEYNLERNYDVFVKNCFGENSYNADDRFLIGNVVEPFEFEVAFYSFAIFGLRPKMQNAGDVISPEKVIYLITDEGLKCKVYYKCEKERFLVRIDHDYDKRYLVKIIFFPHGTHQAGHDYIEKKMYVEKFGYVTLNSCTLYPKDVQGGRAQHTRTPGFIVNIKKISPTCILTL